MQEGQTDLGHAAGMSTGTRRYKEMLDKKSEEHEVANLNPAVWVD